MTRKGGRHGHCGAPSFPQPEWANPTPVSGGTVGQVQAFLDWVVRTRYPVGMASATMVGICSTWRSVTTTLGVDGDVAVSAVDPVELADRFALLAARQPFTSHATYGTRLRRAIDLFEAHHLKVGSIVDPGHPAGGLIEVQAPLRPGLTAVVQLPTDLTLAEADILASLVRAAAKLPGENRAQRAQPSPGAL